MNKINLSYPIMIRNSQAIATMECAQELFEAEADLPQKAAPKRRLAAPKATDDDDDWGNDDLTDVLPPM